MSLTQLLLVRHGTTDANVRVPYILQGSTIDLPLNDNGRRQPVPSAYQYLGGEIHYEVVVRAPGL